MARNRSARFGTAWRFVTAKLIVTLELEQEHNYQYDGDDEDGETQAKLDSGEYVAFSSLVRVCLKNWEGDDEEIGFAALCGSVYAADEVRDFFTAHRTADAMNRNCSSMRAMRGDNVAICHYFPSLVQEALDMARYELNSRASRMPKLRVS